MLIELWPPTPCKWCRCTIPEQKQENHTYIWKFKDKQLYTAFLCLVILTISKLKIYHLDQDLRLFFITFAQKHLLNAQADISCGARSKVWSDWNCIYNHTLCMRKANALARLRRNAHCFEPVLIAVTIKTKISFTGNSFRNKKGFSDGIPFFWP